MAEPRGSRSRPPRIRTRRTARLRTTAGAERGPESGRTGGSRLRRGLRFFLDCLNPGSDGIPLGKRVVTVAAAVAVMAGAVLAGIWIESASPVADHVHTSEGAAQDRADRREPPFAQTDPVHDWSGVSKGEYESWALDRRLTAGEARELRGIDLTDPFEGNDRLARWARSLGARPILGTGPGGEAVLTFQLRGTRTRPVVVNQFRAKVDKSSCRTSRAVTVISFTSQGGGAPAQLEFNLDAPVPVAELMEEDGETGLYQERRFDSLSAEGDPSGFRVEAYSGRTCEWTIEADWEDSFGKGTFTIDDSGKPFVIEAPVRATDVWVDDMWSKRFVPVEELR